MTKKDSDLQANHKSGHQSGPPSDRRDENRARAAKRLLDASNGQQLAPGFGLMGKILSGLATLLSVAPVNGLMASVPLFLTALFFVVAWALCLLVLVSAAGLILNTHNASAALIFFLLGFVGLGLLYGLCLVSLGKVALHVSRRWLSWQFSFLIGPKNSDQAESGS